MAQLKVGKRGQHFIFEVPAGDFDPSEFEKLIDAVKAAKAIGNEHYLKLKEKTKTSIEATQVPKDTGIVRRGNFTIFVYSVLANSP